MLHVDYPVDRDLSLGGRGLRLIPSYFCRRTPIALADPELRPVLVYPIDHSTVRPSADPSGTKPQALSALLGRTRARTLAALHDTATTGELARRLRISPASASQHVHVLAAANLERRKAEPAENPADRRARTAAGNPRLRYTACQSFALRCARLAPICASAMIFSTSACPRPRSPLCRKGIGRLR
ncbi:winged helix-turn-helix domain-containing protein [Streptomyces chartreusis]|uniref:winged helix-turn-helix domain-containing protein n=1 Tax=Streptomyces chartreusis TaxID=1969 RepID=UPI0036ACC2D1